MARRRATPSPWPWILTVATISTGIYLLRTGPGFLGLTDDATAAVSIDAGGAEGGQPGAVSPNPIASTDTSGAPGASGGQIVWQQMEYLEGDGQEADPGNLLPRPYVVEVLGADRRPKSGIEVQFQVVTGGGSAEPSTALTDSLGRASAQWRLGPAPGFQTMAAMSVVVETPVTFTAIARGPPEATRPVTAPTAAVSMARAPGSEVMPIRATPPPAPWEDPRPITVAERNFAVGGASVCTIRTAHVTCRGADDRGQLIVDGLAGTQAVTAGLFHACALDPAGIARCWGANDAGQLGDGTRSDHDTPTLVATELRFSALTAGVSHTCGLTQAGRFACWGQNIGGQLGDGSRDNRATPGPGTAPSFVVLDAGWNHTCGMTESRAVYCWGLNREGQVGDGSTLDRLTPQQIVSSARGLAAGGSHSCVIADGQVLCWGNNGTGQLGDGTTDSSLRPVPVRALSAEPNALTAGAAHTCVLTMDGSAYCWGQNLHGQLGDGTTTNASVPVRVAGDIIFRGLWAGGAVTCGIASTGEEYCWGLNQSGQLGDGTLTSRAIPTAVHRY